MTVEAIVAVVNAGGVLGFAYLVWLSIEKAGAKVADAATSVDARLGDLQAGQAVLLDRVERASAEADGAA